MDEASMNNAVPGFWGEIPPGEHLVQVYENDGVFLATLEEFVRGGIRAGDGVIVIGTEPHLTAVEARLRDRGVDPAAVAATGQYLPRIAEEVLSEFMVSGWPDDARFKSAVADLLRVARGPGRRVRAFGEMVAILWGRGQHAATVRLEHLWHQLCVAEGFSLFCAYPRIGFTGDMSDCLDELVALHTRVLMGSKVPTPPPDEHKAYDGRKRRS